MDSNGRVTEGNEKLPDGTRSSSSTLELKSHDAKIAEIFEACKWRDLESLRRLAQSEGGLISDSVRQQAWPLLLGCVAAKQRSSDECKDKDRRSWDKLLEHRDEDQVRLDVERSFVYYPNDQSAKDLGRRREELSNLIKEVLRRQPYLCYFQGYHDICQVFLLVLEPDSRADAVARLSALRIRDFMLPTLAPALAQLRLIPALLEAENPELCRHLNLAGTQPYFAISGTLTMYAHDIQTYSDISRLFDALLAREAVFSIYMYTQIVLQRSEELFDILSDEQDVLYSVLSKLPNPLDLEALIRNTVKLFERHPPETLKSWRSISEFSVLKTARKAGQLESQTMEDGELYFKKQVSELKRAEQYKKVLSVMWKYRIPAGAAGVAVLLGSLSIWLRMSPGPSGRLGAYWILWMGYRGH